MSWRDNPLYVVEWAGGPDLPYTKKIYTSLTWAKKYLFNYMKKNLHKLKKKSKILIKNLTDRQFPGRSLAD